MTTTAAKEVIPVHDPTTDGVDDELARLLALDVSEGYGDARGDVDALDLALDRLPA